MDGFEHKTKLIKQYCKAIIDMRQKVEDNELILCFGAGVSKSWDIPNWEELVSRIASNEQVKGEEFESLNLSLSSKVQALYEKFKKKERGQMKSSENMFWEDHIRYKWMEIIRHELYRTHKEGNLEHPYMKEYIKIIKKSPVTINYNFDNLIEQCIKREQKAGEWGTGVETIDKPSISLKKTGVIIHPNGFLPESMADSISDHFVFSEKSFQDQLLESIMGRYNPIMYFFSRYTTLFIFIKEPLTDEEIQSIQESYFDTFNLIVLFMDASDIFELGQLLNSEPTQFKDLLRGANLKAVYNYYISGAPGTGKTSALNMLKNYKVYTEFDERNKDLYEDDANLSDEQRENLDKWIAQQFRLRNSKIIEDTKLGIQLIDRSPLDPITYAKDIITHANNLNKEYKRTDSDLDLVSGHIILLSAEIKVLYNRLQKRNPNKYSEEWCTTRFHTFENLFDCKDVKKIDTSHKSIAEITKEIAHLIYFEDYRPINLNNYMKEYCNGKRDLGQSKKKSSRKKGTQSTRDIK